MEKKLSKQTTDRALKQLRTWCTAVGIGVEKRNEEGLVVRDATGTARDVHVVIGDQGLPAGALLISASDLNSRNLRDAFEAFKVLQRELGFNPKAPVNRGKIPDHKLANGEDPHLTAFRHTTFRRAPNPAPEKFETYKDVMTRACRRFYRLNMVRCDDHMLTPDGDLMSYAMIWTTNFCAVAEMEDKPQSENEKLLYTYLMQRFDEFQQLLQAKERNELPMLDDAYIGTRGRTYDYSNKASWEGEDPRLSQDEDEDEGGELIDLSSAEGRALVRTRATEAGSELEDRLGEMGHDRMVEVLSTAAGNNRIHPDARAEAQKRLDKHVATCTACKAVAVV